MARGRASTIAVGAEERQELERLVRGRLSVETQGVDQRQLRLGPTAGLRLRDRGPGPTPEL